MNPEQNLNLSRAQGPDNRASTPSPPAGHILMASNSSAMADSEPSTPPSPTPPQPPSRHHDSWRSILSTLLLFAVAPIIALAIAAFVIQSYQVDGSSMETALQNNDRLIVDKLPRSWARLTHHPYLPNRGDVIVFNQAGLPGSGPAEKKQLIKRVIGLPGERVVIKDDVVTVYNGAHPTGFRPDTTSGYFISSPATPGNIDLVVGRNQIFVCGDNRTNSEDSRYFGPVDVSNVVGKLVVRIFPLNKIQLF